MPRQTYFTSSTTRRFSRLTKRSRQVVDDLQEEGSEAVREAVELLERAGLSVETAIRRGQSADEILCP